MRGCMKFGTKTLHWIKEFLGTEDKIYHQILSDLKTVKTSKGGKFIVKSRETSIFSNKSQPWHRFHIVRYAAVIIILLLPIFLVKYFETKDSLNENPTIAYQQKFTNAGQKLSFRLPDGSDVTLNANSSMEYPEIFSDSTRSVILKGEAFFDIARDENHPFMVYSGHLITVALGTPLTSKVKILKRKPVFL